MKSDDTHDILRRARARIDDLDDEIHALILRRYEAVQEISRGKGLSGGDGEEQRKEGVVVSNPIRFAREAQILRRLCKSHEASGSPLSFIAIARVWHEIIASYTLLQKSYRVLIDLASFAESEHYDEYYALGRSHFGDLVAIDSGVLGGDSLLDSDDSDYYLWLCASPHLEAVLPPEGDSLWWVCLAQQARGGEGWLCIGAALPFVYSREFGEEAIPAPPQAYVVSSAELALSSVDGGQDILCLALYFGLQAPSDIGDASDSDIIAYLMQKDICPLAVSGDGWLYAERHARIGDKPEMRDLWAFCDNLQEDAEAKRLGLQKSVLIGVYALPMGVA